MLMMKKKMMMILKICVDHIYVTLDFDPERWWFVLEKYEIDDQEAGRKTGASHILAWRCHEESVRR